MTRGFDRGYLSKFLPFRPCCVDGDDDDDCSDEVVVVMMIVTFSFEADPLRDRVIERKKQIYGNEIE